MNIRRGFGLIAICALLRPTVSGAIAPCATGSETKTAHGAHGAAAVGVAAITDAPDAAGCGDCNRDDASKCLTMVGCAPALPASDSLIDPRLDSRCVTRVVIERPFDHDRTPDPPPPRR